MRVRRGVFIVICLTVIFCSTLLIFVTIDKQYNVASYKNSTKPENIKFTVLLIIITSAGQNYDKRSAIRNTWLKLNKSNKNFQYLFVVGGKNSNYNKTALEKEMTFYKDILLFSKSSDSYEKLTEKLLYALIHVFRFYKFQFILKCDDDSFVLVSNITHELDTRFKTVNNLYWGFFSGNANVKKTGKWKENNWILCDRYLPYALGGGYILSHLLVKYIVENWTYFNIYKTEDVSVGTWLAPVNVTRIHDPRFDTEYASRGCSNSYLITHKQNPSNMYNLYSSIIKTGKLCELEFKLRLSYLYDWNESPSKCCKRYNISVP